jgi:heat-inducible transcriptional repressor
LERHSLGVSAATVRNDMAVLEEDGLITAPHTSAGRVPTDAGYRLFVDRLSTIKPLSGAEKAAIRRFLAGAVDLDDIVTRTVRLLSSLTNQVAVMQYPSLTQSTVRHIELVPIAGNRLMVVLIVNTGRVEQRVIETAQDLTDAQDVVADLRALVNSTAVGQALTAAPSLLSGAIRQVDPAYLETAEAVVASLQDALAEQTEERLVMAGTANLARGSNDFPTSLGEVLQALEEHVVLLKLMGSRATMDEDAVAVSIGAENPFEGLRTTSVVTTTYGPAGGLGVVGPTRMDYPMAMASVRAVAHYVSTILEN